MSRLVSRVIPTPAFSDRRAPVLDGIRGLAILLVLFHHAVIYSGMTTGTLVDQAVLALGASAWLGVDLFFVLSGFLITGILQDAKTSRSYFRTFYGRRVLRIFPLYYGFLAVWLFVLPQWLPSASSQPAEPWWYWAYLSNVPVARFGWQEPLHLGHFWSLAVEEQFYLVWPLVVRAFDRRRLMMVCAVCFAGALGLRMAAPFFMSPLAAVVLMPMRMDALACGAFLALAVRGPQGLQRLGSWPYVGLAICGAVTAALFAWRGGFGETDRVINSLGLSTFAVGFACIIAIALIARETSLTSRLLGGPLFVFLGQYSYGLYVIHHPVMLLLREGGVQANVLPRLAGSSLPGVLAFAAIACGASVLCALVSWHFFEEPILRLKRYLPYREPPRVTADPAGIKVDSLVT